MKGKVGLRYLEFATASNFSFLRGASHPEELMVQAEHVGLAGLGLCDRNSVAGVVRAHLAKREKELRLRYHPGARLVFSDGTPDVLAYPRDRAGWGRLCRLLTRGNLRAEKGDCILFVEDLLEHADGLELVVMPDASPRVVPGRREAASPDPITPVLSKSPPSLVMDSGLRLRRPRNDKRIISRLISAAPDRVRLAATMLYRGNDRARLANRAALARETGVPLIAVNDVLYHHPERRPLADVVTCIREHLTLDTAGRKLAANAERYLKPPEEMARLFRDAPEAIAETQRLSEALRFSLDELQYEYPDEMVAGFATPQDALEHLTLEGAARRYPDGIPHVVQQSLAHEFALIAARQYAPYFLTVYDIVRYARSIGILCQGRGSAANSTVCYCLGVTSVDPVRGGLLFERFISTERDEPPDIDVDFEHERREEVIQYIYKKYGRDRAGIAATVISYRGRSAIREVGKVFGLSEDTIGALASSIWGMGGGRARAEDLARIGIDVNSPRMRKMQALIGEIQSFPRHLSQHVGGFVITRSRLDEVVPVMNGAMDERTHVEWDKDDLDALKILKVDVLALGMLTCIRKAFELAERHYGENFRLPQPIPPPERGRSIIAGLPAMIGWGSSLGNNDPTRLGPAVLATLPLQGRDTEQAERAGTAPVTNEAVAGFELATVPAEDPAVYRMLCRADSIGVFQVESRAQMSMLPRLRPQKFYDLVIEVAIVRPGPIQGDMVHPYLRRRQKLEPVTYPSKDLEAVLGKTLGVPLFQEQAMKIAIVAGGFTPGEADKLRRAMATFKRTGSIGTFRDKMVKGMLDRGYPRDFAERCFGQIEGFGEYGFPESHAASFALLVYASAWLKCRYPDVFAAALLNAQPMGFYASAQIVRDVREHGVEVRPVDINFSDYDATLEPGPRAAERLHARHADMRDDIRTTHAVRLGLREVKGLSEEDAKRIVEMRKNDPHPVAGGASDHPPPFRGRDQAAASGEIGLLQAGNRTLACSVATCAIPPPERGRSSITAEGGDTRVGVSMPYTSVRDLWLRTGLPPRVIERLADADAFGSLGLSRRQALWAAKALGRVGDKEDDLPLFQVAAFTSPRLRGEVGSRSGPGEGDSRHPERCERPPHPARTFGPRHPLPASGEREVHLPPMPLGEEVVNDYRFLKLSLRAHPASFLRADLDRRGIVFNDSLRRRKSGERLTVSGLVTCRQRPGSAQGVIFMTIEDETSLANIIVWPKTFERFRPIVLGARYVAVTGVLQQESDVIHVVADRLEDLTPLLARLAEGPALESLARCDEVKRPGQDYREKGGRSAGHRRKASLLTDMPDLISDLDVPARGSAHAPNRRAR